ncbi:MAG: hypothetical protein AAGG47_17890 [Pseudomonadota bacterium]
MAVETFIPPVGGSTLFAVALYLGASVAAGQIMAERMIELSGWHESCAAGIAATHKPKPAPRRIVREQRCSTTFGPWLGRDAVLFCQQLGDPDFNGPARRAEEQAIARTEALQRQRLRRATADAPSQCACAARAYRSDQMLSLGLYAGSARQISLPAVEDMSGALREALAAPSCQAMGGGA